VCLHRRPQSRCEETCWYVQLAEVGEKREGSGDM
jgi:hypothetical protein